MTNCRFQNLDFLHLAVFFLWFSSCFCESYNTTDDQGKSVLTWTDPNDTEIVFRIVNGIPAQLGDIPYQVAFRANQKDNNYYTFCGGSIITESKLISAAHCFHSTQMLGCCKQGRSRHKYLAKYFAVAGTLLNQDSYQRKDSERHGQWRKLSAAFYPKQFVFPNYDIAVVFLTTPFIFNAYVAPIPVASARKEYTGTCLVSGYGRLSKTQHSLILNKADLKIISSRECNRIHHKEMKHFICTSSLVSDIHKGDSGGPLVCKNTGDPQEGSLGILVGVSSGTDVLKKHGSFFTRVSSYRTFINSKKSSSRFLAVNDIFDPPNSASTEIRIIQQ
ncbi:chymotrypsin-like protease CTRL-1 [Hyposmocoma kahamanoa]|uniref:chymotrypsin-like protease CTRL-1 n=1 Tax=Hyposmocoma kahamanoa TaxID=1477025 RepID=UPI000E6D6BA5|nr:chymotrypsin-like protease CTRL-1 [Hyposmocoma kahamanoa]